LKISDLSVQSSVYVNCNSNGSANHWIVAQSSCQEFIVSFYYFLQLDVHEFTYYSQKQRTFCVFLKFCDTALYLLVAVKMRSTSTRIFRNARDPDYTFLRFHKIHNLIHNILCTIYFIRH